MKRKRNPVNLLSVEQIAKKYDFHPNTVRRWVHVDGLVCYRKGRGRKMWFKQADLEDFLLKTYQLDEVKDERA